MEAGQGLFYIGTNGLISNLELTNMTITGAGQVGTLAGFNYGSIYDVHVNTTTVIGNEDVGGLVGINYGSIELSSVENASVSCSFRSCGGLVGQNLSQIQSSYSMGSIGNLGLNTGGLVGLFSDGIIFDTYSHAFVLGNDTVGGLIGAIGDSILINSYSTGEVAGITNAGGLIGINSGGGSASDSYWDTDTSLLLTSAGGTGKTTLQMYDPSTYSTWPSKIWIFMAGFYPYFDN